MAEPSMVTLNPKPYPKGGHNLTLLGDYTAAGQTLVALLLLLLEVQACQPRPPETSQPAECFKSFTAHVGFRV